jgi:uncharacterized protein (TIGR02145 family)
MKEKKKLKVYLLIAPVIALVILANCKKDDSVKSFVDHSGEKGSVTDVDGNVYKTIGIGSQIWMAENLKVTNYRNGAPIDNVTDYTAWNSLTSGAYSSYDNNDGNIAVYGLLYNWYAVTDSRNIAPQGWHIPTRDEFDTLSNWLGGELVAGGKLKESGTANWSAPNTDATNESGFTALPGGWRLNMGNFFYMNQSSFWWTKSNDFLPSSMATSFGTDYNNAELTSYATIKQFGLSIRCVKDK